MSEKENVQVVKKKSKKQFLIMCIAILILILTFILVAVLISGSKGNKLNEQLNLGEKFLSELDYEQAIAAYEQAIVIEPKSVEAYVGMAQVYVAQNDYAKALEVLDKGYSETGEASITEVINSIEKEKSEYEIAEAERIEQERIEQEQKEKEEAERLAQQEAERQLLEEEKKKAEEIKNIYVWYILNSDIISYTPVSINDKEETDDTYTFEVVLGYSDDLDIYLLTVDKVTGRCNVISHQYYDLKSGIVEERSDGVGTTYEFVINDEVKEKYRVYDEAKTLLVDSADKINEKLDSEFECIGNENYTYGNCRLYNVDENGIAYGEIYYTMPYDYFTSCLILFEIELDTNTNVLTIVSHRNDYFLEEIEGIDGWNITLE